MNVYLLTGSHLREVSHCLRALMEGFENLQDVAIYVPEDTVLEPVNDHNRHYNPACPEAAIQIGAHTSCFIILSPFLPLPDQFETLAGFLKANGIEPLKIITCVDMEAAESHPAYLQWTDTSIYHSDLVLLGNRMNASKAFIRKFQNRYEKACYPCRFLLLKGPGRPEKIPAILAPDTRRLSQIFDIDEPEPPDLQGLIIESSFDLDADDSPEDSLSGHDTEQPASPPHLPDISAWVVRVQDV